MASTIHLMRIFIFFFLSDMIRSWIICTATVFFSLHNSGVFAIENAEREQKRSYDKREVFLLENSPLKRNDSTDSPPKRKYKDSLSQKELDDIEAFRVRREKLHNSRRDELSEVRRRVLSGSSDIRKKPSTAKLRSFKPDFSKMVRMHPSELKGKMKQGNRRAWGWDTDIETDVYDIDSYFADPGAEYDQWQQAYRTLGAYIDCDHQKENSHDSGDSSSGCSRWMVWAAYVDPNYNGGGYYEYHDNDDDKYDDAMKGSLDCHMDYTEWQLLGVYRQEFYQYLEQISKHLWGEDDWEYVVALATLEYITEDDCFGVGYDNNAAVIYAGIQPLEKGYFQMGLYLDEDCLYPQDPDELGYTYDDFFDGERLRKRQLEQGDDGGNGNYDDYDSWWANAQEYTLSDANEVYDTFKYCTLCLDYPTYQDGQLNGNSGYEDDDLINQCWKFYSHDSYTCSSECIRMGHMQGSLTNLRYGSHFFGEAFTEYSTEESYEYSKSSSSEGGVERNDGFIFSPEKMDRLKANVFVTCTGILFVATFLAFSVARSNREVYPKRRGKRGKSRKEKEAALLVDKLDKEQRRKSSRSRERKGRRSMDDYEPPMAARSERRSETPKSETPRRGRSSRPEVD